MTLFAPLGLSALAMIATGCAAPTATDRVELAKAEMTAPTVKTGAAVTLNTTLPDTAEAGTYNPVGLSFGEAYESGEMRVTLAPSDGLSLFGGQTERVFDLAGTDRHDWSVDVSAPADGIYFLNVFVEAGGLARVFSVSLEIGTVTSDMKSKAMSPSGKLQNGVRVMEADETLR